MTETEVAQRASNEATFAMLDAIGEIYRAQLLLERGARRVPRADRAQSGFRHSDTVLVADEGIEILTYYPRDLASLIIPRLSPPRGTLNPTDGTEVPMTKTLQGKPVRSGDEIVIAGHAVGVASRTAVILEVLGDPGHERFRVRWEDGHESIFFPGEDAVVRRPGMPRAKNKAV